MKRRINDIPEADRPRERLQKTGASALSDLELLAILLGSGTRESDVLTLAGQILKLLDAEKEIPTREVFADPITDRAAAIIVAHNHPSTDLSPSNEDAEVTKRLKAAGEIIGIRLLDHIIFNRKGHYSFLEHGEL